MIYIYLRIVDKQAKEKQISITKKIMSVFFGFSKDGDEITIVGESSGYSDSIKCLTSTDSRLGGNIKTVINNEGGIEEDDILLFKKENGKFTLQVIKHPYHQCNILTSLLPNQTKKHVLIGVDNDFSFNGNLSDTQENEHNRDLPRNLLLYGVAGVGKSYYIKHELGIDENFSERVVFHPDYSNADFIGQILPTVENDIISYKFKAGAFTKILKKAIKDENNQYYLIIEEINRGNAPAIFGEIFQLLDREDDGVSTYEITHELIANEVYENSTKKIYIPKNLSIIATMNSADQNVFTLDTAFQRRWTMRMIENNIDKCNYKNEHIVDTNITWGVFNTVINQCILEANKNTLSSEDKRLGAFFIKENELSFTSTEDNSPFAEKVIKYLWDDVFRFNKSQLFNDEYNSLDEILRLFKNNHGNDRFNIFNMDIKSKLIEQSQNDGREEISDDLQFD